MVLAELGVELELTLLLIEVCPRVFTFQRKILSAQQAAKLCDKNVKVIPTKNVAMGIAALVAFQPDQDADANAEMMDAASQNVRTGTITYRSDLKLTTIRFEKTNFLCELSR